MTEHRPDHVRSDVESHALVCFGFSRQPDFSTAVRLGHPSVNLDRLAIHLLWYFVALSLDIQIPVLSTGGISIIRVCP